MEKHRFFIIAENCKKRILLLAQSLILCPAYKLTYVFAVPFSGTCQFKFFGRALVIASIIIMKGMEPLTKKELVESLLSVLEKSSTLEPQEVHELMSNTKLTKVY